MRIARTSRSVRVPPRARPACAGIAIAARVTGSVASRLRRRGPHISLRGSPTSKRSRSRSPRAPDVR
eukprot:2288438-Pleurochrysis_carterae.AAC.2